METLYERIIRQLDTLVPFLALARQEAFDMISRERIEWFTLEQREAIPVPDRTFCILARLLIL